MGKPSTDQRGATPHRRSDEPVRSAQQHAADARAEWERSKQRLAETVEETRQQGTQVISEAKRQIDQVGADIWSAATEAADDAKTQTSSLLERQKREVASGIGGIQAILVNASSRLREEDNVNLSEYVDAAARRVKQLSSYLERRSLTNVVADLEDVARQRPELVFGGLMVAGLAAARFLKSSSRRRQAKRWRKGDEA